MNDRCISKEIMQTLFKNHSKKIKVFMRSSKTKGTTFDPFRDVGYTKTILNPVFVRGVLRDITPNSLIIREMGLTESGAKYVMVKDSDVEFFRLSEKILIDEKEYYVFNDAVGNRFQITELQFGYTKIIIFRKDK